VFAEYVLVAVAVEVLVVVMVVVPVDASVIVPVMVGVGVAVASAVVKANGVPSESPDCEIVSVSTEVDLIAMEIASPKLGAGPVVGVKNKLLITSG
jgi:hypothetical protein